MHDILLFHYCMVPIDISIFFSSPLGQLLESLPGFQHQPAELTWKRFDMIRPYQVSDSKRVIFQVDVVLNMQTYTEHNVSIVLSYYHEIREISRYPFCPTKLLPLFCVSLRKTHTSHPNSWRTPIRLAPMGPSRYCAFAGFPDKNRRDKRLAAPGSKISKAPRPSPWSPTFHQHKSARATGCWWGLGKANAVEQWGLADHQHNPVCQDPNTIGAGCSYQDLDLQKAGSNKMP